MFYYLIEQRLQQAVIELLPEADPAQILVRPCPNPQFGDYQTSAVIGLAKVQKMNPRQLAAKVQKRLSGLDFCEQIEVAGAGFINFRLKTQAVAQALQSAFAGDHLLFQKTTQPRTVVIDFSSPNVAKPMHVGHIRSTILGDCLARAFRLLGHRVITDNHLGDWGTQFGMLLTGWKRELSQTALKADPIAEMERVYKKINAACAENPALFEQARQELAKLQHGDPQNLGIWQEMIALSKAQFDAVYRRLGVQFDHTFGESFYNPQLKRVVQDLVDAGLARTSEGAVKLFFDDIPELKDHPAVIQKSDGAATYTTTDIATLEHRFNTWHPDEIVYVTDSRQQLHFREIFAAFNRWRPNTIKLSHVWFGSILGEDGKPLKTRSGETVKLVDLLDESEQRAFQAVSEKNPDLSLDDRNEIARIVGLGAIKYADLLSNRQSDYVFSWDKMLALNGNTAPYLLYAYTRIRSIFRKLADQARSTPEQDSGKTHFALKEKAEISLGKYLLNFGLVLEAVIEEYRPNFLCNYLYELAGHFTSFYETCPVLKADPPERIARLALCDLTGRVLKQGLDVLGIETTEKM